jgi:hypothetical protein
MVISHEDYTQAKHMENCSIWTYNFQVNKKEFTSKAARTDRGAIVFQQNRILYHCFESRQCDLDEFFWCCWPWEYSQSLLYTFIHIFKIIVANYLKHRHKMPHGLLTYGSIYVSFSWVYWLNMTLKIIKFFNKWGFWKNWNKIILSLNCTYHS